MIIKDFSNSNSLLNKFLSELRDVNVQKDTLKFRNNVVRIGHILAYELSKELDYNTKHIITPNSDTDMQLHDDSIVLGTILRAGLPLHQGFLDFFDNAENAFVSAFRKYIDDEHEKFIVHTEYLACPSIDEKNLILTDIMLATGSSMVMAYESILRHGTPKKVHLVSVIASQQSVDYLKDYFKDKDVDVTLWTGVIDPILDKHYYIVPGLGDAGDLCYGEKI